MSVTHPHQDPPEDPFWEALAKKVRRQHLKKLTDGRWDLILDDLTLRELRQERRVTQESLARSLCTGQAQISRLESSSGMRLRSLRAYLGALGGTLDLIARFPDGAFRIIENRDAADPAPAGGVPVPSTSPTRRQTSAAPVPARSRR